jgi:flagellar basal-body rod modification protein FlgD
MSAAVNSVNNTNTIDTAAVTSGSNTLSQNDFLTLLMTQLQNQDPMDPADTNEMVTEMAQLTSVQALTNMETDMNNLTSTMATGAVGQWSSSIGDYMEVSPASVSQGESVTLSPTSAYDSLTLTLQDSSGTQSTQTFTSSQTPVYNDIDGSYTVVSATETKNGVATSCPYTVNRSVSEGDEVVLAPSGTYNSLTLTLQDSSGNQTTQTFSSTDSPVYTDSTGTNYTVVGATETTASGTTTNCSYNVYRLIAGVQSGSSGPSLVASDGSTYSTSNITQIIK